ncbi:hypothetical protein CHCC5025_3697 [Bacillus licheniformis]|nr:hypothetical protein CHCC5025_3697 [Bacillus licheniformis]TWK71030.1 hypothetical protein CHCC20339_1028 [Bacillus licheniformis]
MSFSLFLFFSFSLFLFFVVHFKEILSNMNLSFYCTNTTLG